MTPDVNVLLAAARPDHSHHDIARVWLATMEVPRAPSLLLLPMVVMSFVRLVVNPRIFPRPASPAEAFDFIDRMLAAPEAQMPTIGREWPQVRSMCLALKPLKANDFPDVWLAAAVKEHGDHLVTFDTSFRRLLGRSELTVLR